MNVQKISCLILCALFILGAGACGFDGEQTSGDGDKKISVVATIFPPYDFARAVAGEKINLTMLLPPASESHSFEPTVQEQIKIKNCDVFIYVGGESDAWVDDILASFDTSKMRIVKLIDCVEPVAEERVEGMQGDGGEDEYDEHVWTSPRNAKLIVRRIADALCFADPDNSVFYLDNMTDYLAKLDVLDEKIAEVVNNSARKTLVFGDRFPFRYLTEDYGLQYFAAFPGCATETEASVATISFLIEKIKAEKIPAVFHIELGNVKMAKTISEATGAKVLELHACHNISRDDFVAGKTYIDIMNANISALKEALQS